MTKLPDRHRIDPLPPPSGSFDRMLQTARSRRRRQALAVLSSAAALVLVASGAFALGHSLDGVQTFTSNAASEGNAAPGASTTKAGAKKHKKQPRATATRTVKVSAPAVPPPGSAPAASNTVGPNIQLRGHVVDTEGNPIAGLLVQPGARNRVVYESDGQIAALTDRNGNFTIPCPGAPVLLATWPLDHAQPPPAVGQGWAATFVGPADATFPVVPSCGSRRDTTVVKPGSTLTGVVRTVGSCAPDETFSLWVWLDRNREQTVRLSGLRAGETFTFAGLPAGSHTLGAHGVTATLRFQPGVVVTHDATFTCVPGGSGSPSPTSPTPDPSSSPTDTTPASPPPPGSTPTNTPLPRD